MDSLMAELSKMAENTRAPPAKEKYQMLELRKTIEWQNRKIAGLEDQCKDLANMVRELKAIATREGRQY